MIVISIPVLIAFRASAKAFLTERTSIAVVQLAGAACLLVVLFVHVSEAFGLLPSGFNDRAILQLDAKTPIFAKCLTDC